MVQIIYHNALHYCPLYYLIGKTLFPVSESLIIFSFIILIVWWYLISSFLEPLHKSLKYFIKLFKSSTTSEIVPKQTLSCSEKLFVHFTNLFVYIGSWLSWVHYPNINPDVYLPDKNLPFAWRLKWPLNNSGGTSGTSSPASHA
jgi:hypothetical protein